MNNYRNGIMRRMRVYVKEVETGVRNLKSEIKKQDPYKGSPYYDKEVSTIRKNYLDNQQKLKASVVEDLSATLKVMREAAIKKTTTPPTSEMVNTLSILSMLDKITPSQLQLYADQMSNCPLAMLRLQQIASSHNMRINVPDPDALLRVVAVIEDNLAAFLNDYNGIEQESGFRARSLYRYFQPEEYYANNDVSSAENADTLFWNDIVGFSSPEAFEEDGNANNAPIVQYFFGEIDGLIDFIKKSSEKSANPDEVENSILAKCPESYGAAYRAYKATGEKLSLEESK